MAENALPRVATRQIRRWKLERSRDFFFKAPLQILSRSSTMHPHKERCVNNPFGSHFLCLYPRLISRMIPQTLTFKNPRVLNAFVLPQNRTLSFDDASHVLNLPLTKICDNLSECPKTSFLLFSERPRWFGLHIHYV